MPIIFRTVRGEVFQTTDGLMIRVDTTIQKAGSDDSLIEVRHNLEDEMQLPALFRHLADRFQYHRIR